MLTPEEIEIGLVFARGRMRSHRLGLADHCAQACEEKWPCGMYTDAQDEERRLMAMAQSAQQEPPSSDG